jgi:hypothetical protein
VIGILRADIKFEGVPLISFSPVSNAEIRRITQKAPSKSCELDNLFRQHCPRYNRNCKYNVHLLLKNVFQNRLRRLLYDHF